MNYFSTPMPFDFEHIDTIVKINDKVKESKITSLYNCLPFNAEDLTGFEHSRMSADNVSTIEDLTKYIKYTQDKGLDFIYLLTSIVFFTAGDKEFQQRLDKLNRLCEGLLKANSKKIRVGNLQLARYILDKFPEFELHTSTLMEFSELGQFVNMLTDFPEIKSVIPSESASKNFTLLKNLRKRFPDVEIEMMLNEGCMHNCPYRIAHGTAVPRSDYSREEEFDFDMFFPTTCRKSYAKNFWLNFCKSNLIFPWEIKEYKKIGINNFKLVGRGTRKLYSGNYSKIYEAYIRGVEDPKFIESMPIQLLSNYSAKFKLNKDYTVKRIKPYLREIKHFIKNSYKCYSVCGDECTYCYKKAKVLNEKFPVETN